MINQPYLIENKEVDQVKSDHQQNIEYACMVSSFSAIPGRRLKFLLSSGVSKFAVWKLKTLESDLNNMCQYVISRNSSLLTFS